jgi:amino acid transporter
MPSSAGSAAPPPLEGGGARPRLRRVLGLWDLILFGIVLVSPTGPLAFFGVLNERGRGHAATSILLAMFAMLMTAVSYGRMARAYPSAGSAFAYVGQEINPVLGYATGWGIMLDYLVFPAIAIIWIGQQMHVFFPAMPYWLCVTIFAGVITGLNVQNVRMSARVNLALTAGMGLIILIFLAAAARYVLGHPHGGGEFFTRPFYDPQTWSWKAIAASTSLGVLTYIGFDGISTLAEEAREPRRHILQAAVLTCVAIGIICVLEVYAAQLVWPVSEPFPDLDTSFTFVAQRVWAPLFGVVGFTLLVANFGSGMGAQAAAARLLYGMGRSGALPEWFFGRIEPKRRVPRNNVLLVGAIALFAAIVLPAVAGEATGYELGANMLNFGALLAYMGVNAAAFMRYYWRAPEKRLVNAIAPAVGFVVCLLLWWNLNVRARTFGVIWMAAGIAYGAWKTRWFRVNRLSFESPAEIP